MIETKRKIKGKKQQKQGCKKREINPFSPFIKPETYAIYKSQTTK